LFSFGLANGSFGYTTAELSEILREQTYVEFNKVHKKEKTVFFNLGYGLGAMSNLADVLAGVNPGDVSLRTENDPNFSKRQAVIDEKGKIVHIIEKVDTKNHTEQILAFWS
jgi:hypothetical protein